jgi:hypothetical protein
LGGVRTVLRSLSTPLKRRPGETHQ